MSEPYTSNAPEPKVRRTRLSGKATALWLIAFFMVIGLLIPNILRLPLWVDFEIVLAVWWLVWLAVLARMLYVGQRVSDDHALREPRNWFKTNAEPPKKKDPFDIRKPEPTPPSQWWNLLEVFAYGGSEGCAYGIALILALIVLVGLIWFLVEIAVPAIFFLLYLTVRGMLAHVINDRHRCRGRIVRAIAWAFVWATAYTAPLAGVVWFVHYVNRA